MNLWKIRNAKCRQKKTLPRQSTNVEVEGDEAGCDQEPVLALFERRDFVEIWTPSELGLLFAHELAWTRKAARIESLITRCFPDQRDALVWLFLGAHKGYRGPVIPALFPLQTGKVYSCCTDSSSWFGPETPILGRALGSPEREDRQWILKEILYRAPEFGVCRYLGASLFTYFVIGSFAFNCFNDLEEAEIMFSTILSGIYGSRLQEVFGFAICYAISHYGWSTLLSLVKWTLALFFHIYFNVIN
jgi:hypothetical protein